METTNIYFDKIQSYLGLIKEKTKKSQQTRSLLAFWNYYINCFF